MMTGTGNKQKPQPVKFEFITVSNLKDGKSLATRTLVKKHVMRHIGRSRRRPKKNPVILDIVLHPAPHVGSTTIDPFAVYPHELTDIERALVGYIFHDNPQRPFRKEWFPLGQIDTATFQIILSNAALHRGYSSGEPNGEWGLIAWRYHLSALQALNKRLAQGNVDASDGTIGAVTGFMVYNEISADFKQWEVHMQGLNSLINLRGSLDSITFRELRETVSWLETRGSFPQDRRPIFAVPPAWFSRFFVDDKSVECIPFPALTARQWNTLAPSSPNSDASYENLFRLTARLEQKDRDSKGEIYNTDEYAGGWTSILIHTLLSRYGDPPNTTSAPPTQDALRLATLLFVGIIWRQYQVGPLHTSHLANKLLRIHRHGGANWKGCWALQAWTLLIGVIETEDQMRSTFWDLLRALAEEHTVSIQRVIKEAQKVLWLGSVLPGVDDILMIETMDRTMRDAL